MKWMKDPLAGFISRCGARMGKFTALLVTIAMLAGTTGSRRDRVRRRNGDGWRQRGRRIRSEPAGIDATIRC